jgi:FkbM family methyltransferase
MSVLKSLALQCVSAGLRFPIDSFERVGELQTMRDLSALLDIDVVVDVGANRGQFAHELRGVGFRGEIISFEPVGGEFAALSAGFTGDASWRGQQMALGSRESRLEIVIPHLSVLSSLLQPKFKTPQSRTETVQVRRLDAVLPELLPDWRSRRVYLKMDTQGYDLEVFKGASGVLDCIVGLQSEVSVQPLYDGMPHYLDALACYEQAGFELHNLSIVGRSFEGGVVEMNCYMRKRKPA